MYYKVFLLFFLFGVIGLWAQDSIPEYPDATIQLKAYLEKDEVPQNGEVVYHVELIWNGELSRYQISNISDPVVSNLKLRGSGSSNRYFVDEAGNPKSVKQINYYFTPLEMGMAYVDGIAIQYEDKVMNQSETLTAQRLGVKIIEPLSDPTAGMDFGLVVIIVLVALFLIVVIYFVMRYLQQRKLNAEAEKSCPLTLEEKYLELMDKNIELSSDKRNETLNSVTKLLDSYLSEKYKLPGSPEYEQVKIELGKANINMELQNKINNLYERDKLSKFAREQISENELHLFYDTVEQLITKLRENEFAENTD